MANSNFKSVFRKIEKDFNSSVKKKRSQIASAINRELTANRKEIVETLMTKTDLKRKTLNDRLSISRANPSDTVIEGRITPIYGKRIYMSEYPIEKVKTRGNRTAIRLTSPLYRKNMRTGFMSRDGSRMYLRTDKDYVRAVRGRSVPRLFEEFRMKEIFEKQIVDRIKTLLVPLISKI